MIEQPLVSVLMTAYNREKYIAEAIESVLASTYTNFELIIVDDCSTDRTLEIAKSFILKDTRVKLFINEKNLGDYPNRNKAAEYAIGKYIKYLDSDDLIYDFTLDVMVRYMERFPDAGFGLCTDHDHRIIPYEVTPHEIYLIQFGGVGHFYRPPTGSIIRLDAFRKLGGFSGARMIGDTEFWFKIARYYNIVILPVDLYHYRFHDDQQQKSEYDKQNGFTLGYKILITALDDPDCPLSVKEIKIIRKELIRSTRIRYFFNIIKKLVNFSIPFWGKIHRPVLNNPI